MMMCFKSVDRRYFKLRTIAVVSSYHPIDPTRFLDRPFSDVVLCHDAAKLCLKLNIVFFTLKIC